MGDEIEKEVLIKAIKDSFPVEPLPRRIGQGDGDSYVEDECYLVNTYFKDKAWPEITCQGLRDDYPGPGDACLSFMTAEGAAYYLPAYLLIYLNDNKEADVIADTPIYFLCPNDIPNTDEWQLERHALFNKKQRETIKGFLNYVSRHDAEYYGLQQLSEASEYWS